MPAPELSAGATIGAALRWGAGALGASPTAALDSRVLLKAAAGLDDAGLIIADREVLAADARVVFASMIARRAAQEPVAHIVGMREFWSMPIMVEPGVLVPRADSETLIAAILDRRAAEGRWRILDLGCGSGALLCALLASMPAATGLGVDISPGAAALTNRNLAALGLATRGQAVCGDWTNPLRERFTIIISNPPYIAEGRRGSLPREVEAFEDARSLFAGEDGLDAYRSLARALPDAAAEGALIVLEVGAGQAAAVIALIEKAFPAAAISVRPDLAGIPRALIIDLAEGAR